MIKIILLVLCCLSVLAISALYIYHFGHEVDTMFCGILGAAFGVLVAEIVNEVEG